MAQDDTFLIGLVLVVVALIVVAAVAVVFVAAALIFWTRSRANPSPEKVDLASKSLPTSMPPQSMQEQMDATIDFKGESPSQPKDRGNNSPVPAKVQHDETRPVPKNPAAPPVPDHLSSSGPLLGFFDDEPSTRDSGRDTATELFQRGTHSFDWDEMEDDDGATEVFSSHHMDELGEFTIEEEESQ